MRLSSAESLLWSPVGSLCLQSAAGQLHLRGLALGGGGDLGQTSSSQGKPARACSCGGGSIPRKRENTRPFETQAQNQHIITSAVFTGPKQVSQSQTQVQGQANGLHPLLGRDPMSPRKEDNGSQLCRVSHFVSLTALLYGFADDNS